eukprot:TRINITY_DN3655_c0_g2_i1.p2 TRINITY_DN3655_c0_g2~~TRINITY_DN3655_c0_g2_i1.p2  ORF type:complete len:351 (-),score=50.90 TRINITY_DN3655_c0_g2_i1:133-1185(-)
MDTNSVDLVIKEEDPNMQTHSQRYLERTSPERLSKNDEAMLDALQISRRDGDYLSRGNGRQMNPSNFMYQVLVLTLRSFSQSKRIWFTPLSLVQVVLLALFAGLCWLRIPHEYLYLGDHLNAVFVLIGFFSMQFPLNLAMVQFPQEDRMVLEEERSGTTNLFAYFLARILSTIPFLFVHPTASVPIAYWLIGLNDEAGSFFKYLLLCYVTSWTSTALGTLISHLFPSSAPRASVFACVVLHFVMIVSFYSLSLPSWLTWSKYLSYMTYAMQASYIIMYGFDASSGWYVEPNQPSPFGLGYKPLNGSEILLYIGTDMHTLWAHYFIIFGLGTFLYVVAYCVFWVDFQLFRE